MSLEPDLLIDRRRLKRRLLFWRLVALLAILAAVAIAVRPELKAGGRHVARVTITGLITEDAELNRAINDLAGDASVAAVIVAIDSPGGSVGGGEGLHDAIASVAAKKPVVAVMRGTAASAGYMVALSAARIFARSSTLTGSIGVLLPTAEISSLLEKLGVETSTIVSGPLKGQPSLTEPLTPAARVVLQGLVDDMYDQFVTMVAEGRHLDKEVVRRLADGRAYTGRQALSLGLIDAIGGEPEVRTWLESNRNIPTELPIEPVSGRSLFERIVERGFGGLLKSVLEQGVRLDGVWALWQPGSN
jgi:protease-4